MVAWCRMALRTPSALTPCLDPSQRPPRSSISRPGVRLFLLRESTTSGDISHSGTKASRLSRFTYREQVMNKREFERLGRKYLVPLLPGSSAAAEVVFDLQ